MYVSRLILQNWRNFPSVDIKLAPRMFIVGNNGLGKSNLLDAFRFLHDVAKERGGGLQEAIEQRGGMQRIRSLFAGSDSSVKIDVEVRDPDGDGGETVWRYALTLKQEQRGKTPRRTFVAFEKVTKNGKELLTRDAKTEEDEESLTQTELEQIKSNKDFRPLAVFFQKIEYLHLVPQLIRNASDFQARILPDDPYGQNILNEMAKMPVNTQQARLRTITEAVQKIKPQFSGFEFERDDDGQPHLTYRHQNWRIHGTKQNEQQLSDGELRLIGLLWALLDNNQLLLLEEPEISFNEGIVRILPWLFASAVSSHRKKPLSQVILSTHSYALLSDEGIGANEIVHLTSTEAGATVAQTAKDTPLLSGLFKSGLSAADVVMPLVQSSQSRIKIDR